MEHRGNGSEPTREIEQVLSELRAAVRQEAGYLTENEIPTGPQLTSVRDAADLASVSAHLPLQSALPYVGPVIVLAQRVMRLGLRWYINPIVEQQNAFNDSVVRALGELELKQSELNRRLDKLSVETDEESK
ncbi:MAG: hypothetical protein EA415_08975 [Sphaerobacteraceae bacterium]|nr:MAG: hypothetical protein EA415_08975 [Sphaerobacteraceae bacterium]